MLLLRGADVYTPEPIGIADVLVAGGRIVAMAPTLDFPVEEMDAAGLILAPGLVDGHAHLGGGGGEGGAHTRVPPMRAASFLRAGVTTAVGLLGTDCTTRSIADLLAAARGIEHHGVTTYCYTGGYVVPPATLTGSVRGDIVHVDRIVAVGELAISDHRSSQPTLDELLRIAADAHVAGMMTGKAGCVHLHLGDGPRGLELVRRALETEIPARVFHPTHCNRNARLWEEAQALHAQSGMTIDVTAFDADGDAPSGGQAIARWCGRPDSLTLSSDGGGCLPTFDGDGNLLSMEIGDPATLLAVVREACDLGVPLARALATCTANPARQLRLARKGRIAVGADADVILLDRELRVRAVLAGGRRVDPSAP